jgi:hypothetical protein
MNELDPPLIYLYHFPYFSISIVYINRPYIGKNDK